MRDTEGAPNRANRKNLGSGDGRGMGEDRIIRPNAGE